MIFYFSGGGSPWLPERFKLLKDEAVMLSYFSFVNQKTQKLEVRMKRMLNSKKKSKRGKAK